MKPNIGIADAARGRIVGMLEGLLSDEVVLYVKTRNFHWNVTGPQFNDLHKFFESQYEALDDHMDDVAERIRQLGASAPGSLGEFQKAARLGETKGAQVPARAMVSQLLRDHEAVIRQVRKDAKTAGSLGDSGTEDFLVGLMEAHEKMAWMLRAFAE
jgi:starvation-inducible DNA-binding protein